MPEDEAQGAPEVQETPQPDAEAPVEGHAQESEEVDWSQEGPRYKQRYEDLRPELDRTRQQKSQYENLIDNLRNEEVGPALIQEIAPYLFEDEEDAYEDPVEAVQARVGRLEAERQQAQQFAQQHAREQAVHTHLDGQFDRLEERTGLKFSDKDNAEEFKTLQALAYANPIREGEGQGMPDVDAAYKLLYDGVFPKQMERYRESKQGPQAPGGTAAVKTENLDTREAREEHMARRIQEIEAAQDL